MACVYYWIRRLARSAVSQLVDMLSMFVSFFVFHVLVFIWLCGSASICIMRCMVCLLLCLFVGAYLFVWVCEYGRHDIQGVSIRIMICIYLDVWVFCTF